MTWYLRFNVNCTKNTKIPKAHHRGISMFFCSFFYSRTIPIIWIATILTGIHKPTVKESWKKMGFEGKLFQIEFLPKYFLLNSFKLVNMITSWTKWLTVKFFFAFLAAKYFILNGGAQPQRHRPIVFLYCKESSRDMSGPLSRWSKRLETAALQLLKQRSYTSCMMWSNGWRGVLCAKLSGHIHQHQFNVINVL